MTTDLILAQDAAFLVSFWKPLLVLIPFVAWAWLISTKLDKDAKFYHLNFRAWNGAHLAAGVVALAAALLIKWIWLGVPVAVLILLAPIVAYWQHRNARVPQGRQYHLTSSSISDKMEERRQKRATREALIRFADSDGREHKVPGKEDPLLPVHVLAEDLLGPAAAARASKLELIVTPAGAAAVQVVDGVRYKRQPIPAESGAALIDYLKTIAHLDINDRRRRQTGTILMRTAAGEMELSLTTEGSSGGQKLWIEFDRAKRLLKPFDGLGLLPAQMEALAPFVEVHERHGIILLGAPPGHGLSTTSYSFLNRHDAYTSNIKTLEREIQVWLDGVDQVPWDPTNPNVDYATNLQSILRRDPDLVLTGEILDRESAKVAAAPGITGPLLYIPQRVASVAEQIRMWVSQVNDLKQATQPLRAVVNQRLVRSLCPNCRQAYQPSAEQLRKLNLPAGRVKQLYRAGGKVQVKNKIEDCPVCGGTGFLGQTGAFEVMIIDHEARRMLGAGDLKGAQAHARRNKMMLLQEAALAKVLTGETSLEEVVRVLAPHQEEKPAPPPRPKADPAGTPT